MTRPVPELAIAWTDGTRPKRYVSRRSAYYAIAKELVLEKYPPEINLDGVDLDHWEPELLGIRAAKARALFFETKHGDYFDERRWRAFITRVARFLMFVDSKRDTITPTYARSLQNAQLAYERAERASVAFAELAARLQRVVADLGGPR